MKRRYRHMMFADKDIDNNLVGIIEGDEKIPLRKGMIIKFEESYYSIESWRTVMYDSDTDEVLMKIIVLYVPETDIGFKLL